MVETHRHSSRTDNFKAIHFFNSDTGEMLSGPRASKEAIATLKNVLSEKMSKKLPEEEEKVSIFEI
jgi:hypothetical protein